MAPPAGGDHSLWFNPHDILRIFDVWRVVVEGEADIINGQGHKLVFQILFEIVFCRAIQPEERRGRFLAL